MSKFGKTDASDSFGGHVNKRLNTGRGQGNQPVDENSEVVKCFRKYAAQLDQKHDRYERIVKLSRDVTIESKRIIFLLHSIDRNRENVLSEAKKRLDNLVANSIFQIAKELKGEDPHQYHRAFTFGLQEFIEAYTFYHYLIDKTLNHWDTYQNLLKYSEGHVPMKNELMATLLPTDYLLGVADLSGELMRMCINNLGSGDIQGCFETCEVVRKLYAGFLSIRCHKAKEMADKITTLRQSLLKMENVCYNINIRSKEMPQHMLFNLVEGYGGDDKKY